MANKQTIKLTPAQRRAVDTVGRDVLVTASAGTGKTAALSQRCAARVCDEKTPIDADRLLVLTFTDAAAEEMRSRIAETLRQTARLTQDSRLRQQALLLDGAYISTIHAFCKRTLTEFFHAADVDPAFAILDPDEQRLLKSEVLQETLEQAWAEPSLAEAMRILFAGRRVQAGTGSFVDRIIPLSAFLDSVAGRQDFYARAARFNDAQDAAYAELIDQQRQIILRTLTQIRQRLEFAAQLDAHYFGGSFIAGHIRSKLLPEIETCATLLEKGRLDLAAERIQNANLGRFPNRPKGSDKDIADFIKAPAKKAIELFKSLSQFAALNPAYDAQLAGAVSLQSRTLLELMRRFDAAYAAAKRRRKTLDFADLEHCMLRLLETDAAVAETLRQRFEYVFIDEYQDINAVQQRILDLLSRGDNVFAVGDIKQSIYAFRQSRPEIFLSRLATAAESPQADKTPLRVDMNDNFRSRAEILNFVNALFGRIMTENVADMNYDQRAKLKPQFAYPPFAGGHPVELHILDEDVVASTDNENPDEDAGDNEAEDFDAAQRQAAFIAQRIRRMVGADGGKAEFEVYDRAADAYRPVRYGDIVILMRSLSRKANVYVETLRLAGIPVNAQSACGYFETTEIADCLNLLKTLDNPNGDIELAAVLRSPLFDVSDTELAKIRFATASCGNFYEAVLEYARRGDDHALRDKLNAALTQLNDWRRLAQHGSLSAVIDAALNEKGLLAFYAALPNGAVRRANLLKLHDRAIQFERFRTSRPGMGLTRFVEFLEKLRDAEQDWAPGQPDSIENAVQVMSVHKSKGLEFPVVIAAELQTKFNLVDQCGECLIDEQTVGLQAVVEGGRFRLSSAAHQVLAERKRRQTIAEEMRILYVLLTRAREKLILTAAQKEDACRKSLSAAALMRPTVADWLIGQADCHLDWLLAAIADDAALHRLYATGFESTCKDRNLLIASRIDRAALNTLTESLLNSKRSMQSIAAPPRLSAKQQHDYAAAYAALETSLGQAYPFAEATGLCAKFSVSALTHPDDEFAPADVSGAFEAVPAAVQSQSAETGKIDPRQVGTAAHRVFERLPLDRAVTADTVAQTLAALVNDGVIPPPIAEHIDAAGIAGFFDTEPGQAALAAGGKTLREWPFTLGVEASELGATLSDEIVIVQGIVDLIIPTAKGLIVADFKTDRIRDEAALQQRIAHHRLAVDWYAKAAERILKQPVISRWLYFAHPRQAVQV